MPGADLDSAPGFPLALLSPPPCQPALAQPSGPWKECGPSPPPASDLGLLPLPEPVAHLWNLEGLLRAEWGQSEMVPWCPAQNRGPVGAHCLPGAWWQGGRQNGWRHRAGRVERAKKAHALLLLPPPSAGFHLWRENNSRQILACCSFSLPCSPYWPFLAWALRRPPPQPLSPLPLSEDDLPPFTTTAPPTPCSPWSLRAGRLLFPLPSVLGQVFPWLGKTRGQVGKWPGWTLTRCFSYKCHFPQWSGSVVWCHFCGLAGLWDEMSILPLWGRTLWCREQGLPPETWIWVPPPLGELLGSSWPISPRTWE